MTNRRTQGSHLTKLAQRVVKIQGRPSEGVGSLALHHAAEYGGWDLIETITPTGGVRSLIKNDFGGRGRLKAFEMECFLLGMLSALEDRHEKDLIHRDQGSLQSRPT